MQKLCLIFNIAPRYREAIYQAIDHEYECEWYFGRLKTDIKEMDLSLLKHTHHYKCYGNPTKFYWKKGILSLLFKKENKTFLTLAESRSITDYVFFGLARLMKKKVFVWTHGIYGKENRIEIAIKKWMFRQVEGIFVYSDYSRDLMIKEGLSAKKIFTIHNSLDYGQQRLLRESIAPSIIYNEHFGNENPTIIFIGRLTQVKKLDMLVNAIFNLKKRGENYNLVFVGDGAEKKSLEAKVKSMGMQQNVWFYGACYDEKKNAELIYNADLCVSPGNVGLTAIHSLVFGCPVITHNCFKRQMPEFEAIIEGRTGSFYDWGEADSLVDAIIRWFKEHNRDREEVRNNCYKEIDLNWTPQFQLDVIREVIK